MKPIIYYILLFFFCFCFIVVVISCKCRFTEDIYQMTGYRPGLYWQLTWRYIGPFIMCCVLISSVVFMIIKNPKYGAWSAELVSLIALSIELKLNKKKKNIK